MCASLPNLAFLLLVSLLSFQLLLIFLALFTFLFELLFQLLLVQLALFPFLLLLFLQLLLLLQMRFSVLGLLLLQILPFLLALYSFLFLLVPLCFRLFGHYFTFLKTGLVQTPSHRFLIETTFIVHPGKRNDANRLELNGLQQFLTFLQPDHGVNRSLDIPDHTGLIDDYGGSPLDPDKLAQL